MKRRLAVVSEYTRRIARSHNGCYLQHKGTSRCTQTKNLLRSSNKDTFRSPHCSENEDCCIPVVMPCSLVPIHQITPCNIPEDSSIYVMTNLDLLRGENCNKNYGKQKRLLGLSRFSLWNGSEKRSVGKDRKENAVTRLPCNCLQRESFLFMMKLLFQDSAIR